jgi:hypothetical protein
MDAFNLQVVTRFGCGSVRLLAELARPPTEPKKIIVQRRAE